MKFNAILIFLLFISVNLSSQSVGDTLSVKVFDFNSSVRDTVIDFPSDPSLTFEKIILKYTMRCHDAAINTGNNEGCGEWDYSCNTYLVDSSKIESVINSIPSHYITNFEGEIFPYKETPNYDYLRSIQSSVNITSTDNESSAEIGAGIIADTKVIPTSNIAGKSYFLYTAEELQNAGLTAGEVNSLSLNVLENSGEGRFFRINLKQTNETELTTINQSGFTEVYHNHTIFQSNESNRFDFHTPFTWDGESSLIVEFNFTNIESSESSETIIETEVTDKNMGLISKDENEIILTNNSYIQCDDYLGITGNQSRTIEAWIKTTDGSNGEILSWGTIITGRKWVFRLADGQLRVEVHGGGVESTKTVDDGEWHHVACVFNGNTVGDVQFYIDGELDVNSTTSSTVVDTRETLVRISRGVNNRYLDATIDDVRMWNTNLSAETLNTWKNLKVNESHPNFDNLQLNYEFDESSEQVIDQSINGRNATLIGNEFSVSHQNGSTLFKDFEFSANKPNLVLYQGDYTTEIISSTVDKPVNKDPRHFVISRVIEPGDPTKAFHDVINEDDIREYWTLEQAIYDEITGELIEENVLEADGEIVLTDLDYYNRYPYYNELVSFVTPYGNFLDLGPDGKSWYMDMSDYVSILNNKKRVIMTLGGQFNEEIDMEFLFIVGTPPRDVLQYDQVWQGTNRIGIARIAQILDDTKFQNTTINVSSGTETMKLKSSITGHGSDGEFGQNGGPIDHKIFINEEEIFNWDITRECSLNPIYPQGGTWIYDRQGWCPGERTFMQEHDLTEFLTASGEIQIDYNTSSPNNSAGDYRYHMAHQVVSYGPANFQTDASILKIVAPNNSAEYIRVGTICANPMIVIQNTGANELTELTINYWINDSQSPQSFQWTGSLGFMETEEVFIPSTPELWFDILEDNNKFHAEISNVNQGNDEYPYNNTLSSSFDVPEVFPSNFTLTFKTNNNSNENNYKLFDEEGNEIESNSLIASNTVYTSDLQLEEGCYKLSVIDTGGDGIQWWANTAQGTGYITISDMNGTNIKTFEPDFGGGFDFNFTTDFVISVDELNFLTSIKVYPNPTSDFVTINADDLTGAKLFIADVNGNKIESSIIEENQNMKTFNITQLQSGIYFLVIEKDEVLTTRRIIKE